MKSFFSFLRCWNGKKDMGGANLTTAERISSTRDEDLEKVFDSTKGQISFVQVSSANCSITRVTSSGQLASIITEIGCQQTGGDISFVQVSPKNSSVVRVNSSGQLTSIITEIGCKQEAPSPGTAGEISPSSTVPRVSSPPLLFHATSAVSLRDEISCCALCSSKELPGLNEQQHYEPSAKVTALIEERRRGKQPLALLTDTNYFEPPIDKSRDAISAQTPAARLKKNMANIDRNSIRVKRNREIELGQGSTPWNICNRGELDLCPLPTGRQIVS